MSGVPIAVYVHVPFCPSKCGYCDFNSYAMEGEIMERTVQATEAEIRRSPAKGRVAKSVFFGGGTPTFLSESQLVRLLDAVRETHPLSEECEITTEANPGTADVDKFRALRSGGFNRISLGAQSFDTSDLIRLGRVHDASQIGTGMGAARRAGFDNINLDLMFALPGQSSKQWQTNLDLAITLEPEHLSLYCLTIEPNTRYFRLHLKGMLDLPDEDSQVQMYDMAVETCVSAGYRQYEISNFARPSLACQHNICYWKGEEYAGYGPGAVGCLEFNGVRTRYVNTKHPVSYCDRVEALSELWCEQELLDASTRRVENVMLGLRMNDGLDLDHFEFDSKAIDGLVARKWVSTDSGRLKLTALGRHFCTEVALELI